MSSEERKSGRLRLAPMENPPKLVSVDNIRDS